MNQDKKCISLSHLEKHVNLHVVLMVPGEAVPDLQDLVVMAVEVMVVVRPREGNVISMVRVTMMPRMVMRVVPVIVVQLRWRATVNMRVVLRRLRHVVVCAAPMIRVLCKGVEMTLQHIYDLFPGGPVKGACRVAGLPRPDSCV